MGQKDEAGEGARRRQTVVVAERKNGQGRSIWIALVTMSERILTLFLNK